MTKLSVAICTFNRARLLDGALRSLAAAAPPRQFDWEVLVILNNCTDGSSAVVEAHRQRLPIVCREEPRPGLSHARNQAVETAAGDYILWIDDDVRVHPDFLRAYEAAMLEHAGAAVFGGAILPEFEGTPPAWLLTGLAHVETAFAARRPPPQGGRIRANRTPYGANFAIRTEVQRRHPYDPVLGKQPGFWVVDGEETSVIKAILQSGAEGWWVPGAIVAHIMPPERQTVRYVYRHFLGNGRVDGRRDRLAAPGVRLRDAVKELWLATRAELRYRSARRRGDPQEWVPLLRASAGAWGRWIGFYASRRAPK